MSFHIFIALTVFVIKTNVYCALNTPSLENLKDRRVLPNLNYTNKNLIITENNNHTGSNLKITTFIPDLHRKKWQIGRVSSKTYEVVNMLWRKTKIFQDLETASTKSYMKQENVSNKIVYRYPKEVTKASLNTLALATSTPSFIEFYYLDENDDTIRKKECSKKKPFTYTKNLETWPFRHFADFKLTLLNPVFAFHVNNGNNQHAKIIKPKNQLKQSTEIFYRSPLDFRFVNLFTIPAKFTIPQHRNNITTILRNGFIGKQKIVIKTTKKSFSVYTKKILNKISKTSKATLKTDNSTTHSYNNFRITTTPFSVVTDNDKIKFFELYDKNTYKPIFDNRNVGSTADDIKFVPYKNQLKNEQETLEHVNQNIGHGHDKSHQIKHAKKHIIEYEKNNAIVSKRFTEKSFELKLITSNVTKKINPSSTEEALRKKIQIPTRISRRQYTESKYANWSDYSFVAVYIYEPLQVHCDAATISGHWLITAGSCLSRHHKKPSGLGRSAFVSYCGEAWWEPERVAYVKYSVVHPGYHPRDKKRKRLYNIGLIQVVNSMMSACNGLLPISLMSHQLFAGAEGSKGNAIGWGLDRFDIKYPTRDLPRSKLSIYEGRVYSDSCPGNVDYSKAKRLDEFGGTKNVYCLSLPPYSSEENDTVHGSLLLVGGKLIAMYLQEERRPWGEQCAEYTGTWRLIPWVLDIARETEDSESFTSDL